jgi:hypothetical protein
MVTRKVAAKKRKTVLKFTDNYRQFSEQRRQLRALETVPDKATILYAGIG